MATIETLKKKIIKHLASVELSALNMQDLNAYMGAVSMANTMMKPDYFDNLMKNMYSSGCMQGKAEDKEEK